MGPESGRASRCIHVGSHLIMDALPLPYDSTPMRSVPRKQALLTHAWNVVIDLAVYGGGAVVAGGIRK
jgi:hypothetical protein